MIKAELIRGFQFQSTAANCIVKVLATSKDANIMYCRINLTLPNGNTETYNEWLSITETIQGFECGEYTLIT